VQRLAVNLSYLFWKEIVHFFREPSVRTIYLLLPALSAPILFLFGLELALINKAHLIEKPTKVCLVSDQSTSSAAAASADLRSKLLVDKSINSVVCASPSKALENHEIDGIITVKGKSKSIEIESFDSNVDVQQTILVTETQNQAMSKYFNGKNLPTNVLEPFSIASVTTKPSGSAIFYQAVGATAALFGLLLVGNITAILTIGEFDYHTIETTLMQPSRRLAVSGKAMAAALISIVPGTLGFLSFSLPTFFFLAAIQYHTRIELQLISLLSIVATTYMICLFTAFIDFGASILMKGAKLSTVTTSYVNGGFVLVALVGYTMPVETNIPIALVPVLNVCNATRTLISGEPSWICAAAFLVMSAQLLFIFALTEPLFTLDDAATNVAIALHKFLKFKNRALL
jgi:hypothetical protein